MSSNTQLESKPIQWENKSSTQMFFFFFFWCGWLITPLCRTVWASTDHDWLMFPRLPFLDAERSKYTHVGLHWCLSLLFSLSALMQCLPWYRTFKTSHVCASLVEWSGSKLKTCTGPKLYTTWLEYNKGLCKTAFRNTHKTHQCYFVCVL